MSEFARAVFTGGDLVAVSPLQVKASVDYKKFLNQSSSSDYLPDAASVIAALALTLGDRVTLIFLRADAETTIDIASNIFDDHIKIVGPSPKDLQVNLVVNIVKEIILNKDLPLAQRYGAGEDLIRRCVFDGEFKYALKCSLFDQNTMNSPYIKLVHYPPPVTNLPMNSSW